MNWYLVYTKSGQEKCALQNLEQQGYPCYLPLFLEKIHGAALTVTEEPLFPRYMFIRLDVDTSAKNWWPIRSAKEVGRLLSFGTEPVKVDNALVEALCTYESVLTTNPERLFKHGDQVHLLGGAFADIEAVYQMADGEHRALVLIEWLGRQVSMRIASGGLRKTG